MESRETDGFVENGGVGLLIRFKRGEGLHPDGRVRALENHEEDRRSCLHFFTIISNRQWWIALVLDLSVAGVVDYRHGRGC